jgi:hypothetical protein
MGAKMVSVTCLAAAILLAGCGTPIPPGAERGPNGTMAYYVLIDATPPGARIEANGADIGKTPVYLKIFGDPDGTFHDFGSYFYEVRALPVATNQFIQTRLFRTGHLLTPEDRIPSRIDFDMNRPAPPPYVPYGYPPPVYYGPPYYYGPYYGPEFQFYFGPRFRGR